MDHINSPLMFAVDRDMASKKPYIVRTAEQVFSFATKTGASRKCMSLMKDGYTLDPTGKTAPAKGN